MSRSSVKNLAIAAAIAALVAVSPLTPNEWLPSFGIGGLLGLAFYLYQVRIQADSPEPVREDRRDPVALRLREIPIPIWAALIAFCVVFATTMIWLYKSWTGSVWQNNHGIFMPVLMLWLGRSVLRQQESREDDTSAWGFLWLGLGMALAVMDSTVQTRYLSVVGLVACLPGLSLLILGVRRTRALRVVWLLGLFMIPVPSALSNHLFLRNTTAAGTLPLLRMVGLSASQEYSVLDLASGVFVVSDACSGFATLYSAFALTMFLICYCPSKPRRAALLLAFFPLALVANILRVLILILMATWGGTSLLDTALHEASGVATFFIVIGGLFFMADRRALRDAFQ